MSKTKFLRSCPKTRAEFVSLWNSDFIFQNNARVNGFNVIGENVVFPNGMVANSRVV